MSEPLPYEAVLAGVSQWVNTHSCRHVDEVPSDEITDAGVQTEVPEGCGQEGEQKGSPRAGRSGGGSSGRNAPSPRRLPTRPAGGASSTADSGGNSRDAGGPPSSPRSNNSSERKRQKVLLIPLRTLDTEWARRAQGPVPDLTQPTHSPSSVQSNSGGGGGSCQRRPFPERLWKPRRDYSADPPPSVAAERNRASSSSRAHSGEKSPGGERHAEFTAPARRADWPVEAPLPPNAKNLAEVPRLSPERVEKLTAKLMKPLPRRGPIEAAPPEPLSPEEQAAIVQRLTRPRRVDDSPRHAIIPPLVLDEEDVEDIVKRLATPRREPVDRRVIPAPPKHKLASLDEQRAVTQRLHRSDFYKEREAKWAERHERTEGYVPSEARTYDQFFKLSSPTSGRRQGTGVSPTHFIS